jgi:ribosomal protein S18 acetylase RimI-like enzyme
MHCDTRKLLVGEEQRALVYLRRRPLDNAILLGLINDYGLQHPFCRGTFYGHFRDGQLAGVALLGYHVLLSGDLDAVAAFAQVARRTRTDVRLMLGPEAVAAAFAPVFMGRDVPPPHRSEVQLFMVLDEVATVAAADTLRPATQADIDKVAAIHALACVEQTGIDPRATDATGFRTRVGRRIELGRIWIAEDAQGICFKTDVACETESIAYVEGVVTRPDVRGMGVGVKHLSNLCRRLLQQNEHVCLFVRADEAWAGALYHKVGFRLHQQYRFIRFLRARNDNFSGPLPSLVARPTHEAVLVE